jgi:gamma-glutamyltranspeptidase/glutathione hydrolase
MRLFVPAVAIVVASSAGRAQQAETQPVTSRDGMVITTSAPASDVGAGILKRGGNAVDAAVATAFALAVTHPSAGNIGGGGFMVIRLADGSSTIDFCERALMRSAQAIFRFDGLVARQWRRPAASLRACQDFVRGGPRTQFGKLAWRNDVMQRWSWPRGFVCRRRWPIHSIAARLLASKYRPRSRHGKPGGAKWVAGDTIVLRDLGRTLRAIATNGPNAFYTGWIADSIAASMSRNGGLISKRDLAAYQAKMRTPLHGTYRGYDLITMPPPTSGGVTMLEMLNILERFDLAKLGDMSPAALHVEIEAMRRGYLDRARYLNVRFREDAVARLNQDPTRSRSRRLIPRTRRAAWSWADIVTQVVRRREATRRLILDRRPRGNSVSNTFTLEGGFRCVVVGSAGSSSTTRWATERSRETNHWRHRHAGESHRAGQAHAQLDEPHDRHEERQAVHGDGLAGRAYDHQYGDGDRARRHRFRAGRAAGGGFAAVPPSVAAGHGDLRAQRDSRFGGGPASGDGPRRQVRPGGPGRRAYHSGARRGGGGASDHRVPTRR